MDRARAVGRVRHIHPPPGRSSAAVMPTLAQPPLPTFSVRLSAPDIRGWIAGNTGVPGFTTRDSGIPGPHVALLAVAHGNEIAGAIVLDRLLRAGLSPS